MTVSLDTIRVWLRRVWWIGILSGSIWLSGCNNKQPGLIATLTFKDGSHFSGTVIRREPNSITLASPSGDTHTFLYTEISDIKYGASASPPASAKSTAQTPQSERVGETRAPEGGAAQPSNNSAVIQLPAGTQLPVASAGMLDSSFVPIDALSMGVMDSDVKGPNGKVIIPQGANVAFVLRNKQVVAGRMQMDFELVSLDFGNRHYLVSSAKGETTPGVVATFLGPPPKSDEAKLRGTNVHIDDNGLMPFRTETPTVLKVSQ